MQKAVQSKQDSSQPAAKSLPSSTDLNNQGVEAARQGHFEQAVVLLKQALSLESGDAQIRENLSGILIDWAYQLDEKGQADKASSCAEDSLTYDPENGKALVFLGTLAYSRDDLSQAVDFWKRSLGMMSSTEWTTLSNQISQAERDLVIEKKFADLQTEHFMVRFEGAHGAEGVTALGALLEREYSRLFHMIHLGPTHVAVIVYANDNFKRIAEGKDWVLGLYNGRIRLRLEELGTERASWIVAHELAHAFLAHTYGRLIPIWVHEGFAQFCETPHPMTEHQKEILESVTSRRGWVPLKWLDRRFQQPSNGDDLARSYIQARWVVDFLITTKGMTLFQQFLKKLSSSSAIDQAFDQTFAPLSWAKIDQGILE